MTKVIEQKHAQLVACEQCPHSLMVKCRADTVRIRVSGDQQVTSCDIRPPEGFIEGQYLFRIRLRTGGEILIRILLCPHNFKVLISDTLEYLTDIFTAGTVQRRVDRFQLIEPIRLNTGRQCCDASDEIFSDFRIHGQDSVIIVRNRIEKVDFFDFVQDAFRLFADNLISLAVVDFITIIDFRVMAGGDIHAALPGQMRRVVENVAMAYGCTAELDFTVATEVLYSDPAVTRRGMESVAKIVGAENAVTCGPKMIAEDFCYYTLHAPSVFFNLGARVPDESKVFPLHSDHVVFDENAIEVGASVFIQTAVDLLDELNAESNKE